MPEPETPPPNPNPASAPAPAPQPQPAPPPNPGPPPAPEPPRLVSLPAEEYEQLLATRRKLSDVEAEQRRVAEEKESARLKAIAKEGDYERALKELAEKKDADLTREKARADTLEAEILTGHLAREVSSALLGVAFVSPEAAQDAREKLERRFESVRDAAGRVHVREKGTGRPAAEAVKDFLASPAAAHFLTRSTGGGSGARGGDQVPPGQPGGEPSPVARHKAALERYSQVAAGAGKAPGLAGDYAVN